MGRYVERTDGLLRLLRARHVRLAEGGKSALPLQEAIDPLLVHYGLDPAQPLPDGVLAMLQGAVSSAGEVRDRFSPDGWSALHDLDRTARKIATRVTEGHDAARAISALLRKLAGFSGLVQDNMYRFFGWRFLSIGRQHERALHMSALLVALADPAAPNGALDLAIELGDSVLTHRRRFSMISTRDTVIDLLGLDGMIPLSIRAQIDGMHDQVQVLPGVVMQGVLSPLGRAMLRLQTEMATETPETLTTEALVDLRGRIATLSDHLTEAYLR